MQDFILLAKTLLLNCTLFMKSPAQELSSISKIPMNYLASKKEHACRTGMIFLLTHCWERTSCFKLRGLLIAGEICVNLSKTLMMYYRVQLKSPHLTQLPHNVLIRCDMIVLLKLDISNHQVMELVSVRYMNISRIDIIKEQTNSMILEVLSLSFKLSTMVEWMLRRDLQQCKQLYCQILTFSMMRLLMDLWSILSSSIVVLRR